MSANKHSSDQDQRLVKGPHSCKYVARSSSIYCDRLLGSCTTRLVLSDKAEAVYCSMTKVNHQVRAILRLSSSFGTINNTKCNLHIHTHVLTYNYKSRVISSKHELIVFRQ